MTIIKATAQAKGYAVPYVRGSAIRKSLVHDHIYRYAYLTPKGQGGVAEARGVEEGDCLLGNVDLQVTDRLP